jgi:hypothetical protein
MKYFQDQADCQARHDKLLLQCRNLSASLESLSGEKISIPADVEHGGQTDLVASTDQLEAHLDMLQEKVNAAAKSPKVQPMAPAKPAAAAPAIHEAKGRKLTLDEEAKAFLDKNPNYRASEFLPPCRQ